MDLDLGNLGDEPGDRRLRGRALLRGEIEVLLEDIGRLRAAARRDDAMQLDRLTAVMPIARAVGLSQETIAEKTNLSRPTLAKLREPDRQRWSDAELAVLVALALGGSQTAEQAVGYARTLGLGDERELTGTFQILASRGLIARGRQAGHGGDLVSYFRLTASGEEAIRARLGHAGVGKAFRWKLYFGVAGDVADSLIRVAEARLGTGEVARLHPGLAGNEETEIALIVRAASREEAIEAGRRKFAEICRDAGVQAAEVAITILALDP